MNLIIYIKLYFQHQIKVPLLNMKKKTPITLAMAHVSVIAPYCGGARKKQEIPDLHGFSKIKCCHEKRSLSFTLYKESTKHRGKA
jgi:hypothetical protein